MHNPYDLTPEDRRVFSVWLERWALTPDGPPLKGNSSQLLPVRRGGEPAMLKMAMEPREIRGSAYLDWLGGEGAARVFAREGDAVLIERAMGPRSLFEMEQAGQSEAALGILVEVAARLHAPRATSLPDLYPQFAWFDQLRRVAGNEGGVLGRALAMVEPLLADQREVVALHGDLHQWNVLDGEARGWLAIDPSGVFGERAFDFALMVLPCDLETDKDPAVLLRRAQTVARLARIEPRRLVQWVMAQVGLWAAWGAPGRNWRAVALAAEQALGA